MDRKDSAAKVFSLGNEGDYGFFILHQGMLIYADPDQEPQLEVPIRILQDVVLQPNTSEKNMSKLFLVYNFETGFEILLPQGIAIKARLWILSNLGMMDAKYPVRTKKEETSNEKQDKPKKIYSTILIIFVIGFIGVLLSLIFKPAAFMSVRNSFVRQNPHLAEEYYQKAVSEQEAGNYNSAISFYQKAVLYNKENQNYRDKKNDALALRIEQNIVIGNFVQAKEDLNSLPNSYEKKSFYQGKIDKASQNYTLTGADFSELVSLFFRSFLTNDPNVKQKFSDKAHLFSQKLEFTLK